MSVTLPGAPDGYQALSAEQDVVLIWPKGCFTATDGEGNPVSETTVENEIESVKEIDPREDIFRLCMDNETVLMEMKREETSLEDIFRKLTGKDG